MSDATRPIRAKALVFNDPQSQRLLEQVERVPLSNASALPIGETGTGKELIARHIHACSERTGPFVAVNCGAFAETPIDAELFGHESGVFTGASHARAGGFEAAHGGTLFLDEIGDMPMPLQVKLLRVLQERQVVRLGARQATAVDVRLVAAANVDLIQAVEAGRFSPDLFYRRTSRPCTCRRCATGRATSCRWRSTSPTRTAASSGSTRRCSRQRWSACCSPTAGPATSASWRTSSTTR